MNIQLTPEETQFVLNTLAEKPYQQVAGLISKIVQQVQNEQAAQTDGQAPPKGDAHE